MKASFTSIVFSLSLSMGAIAFAQDVTPLQGKPNLPPSDAITAAATAIAKQRQIQNRLDFLLAPIKSQDDLVRYLATTPKAQSPLEWLSPGAKQRLLASLFFNENGLVSYDYADLVNELSASQAYQVLGLFGAQRTMGALKGIRVSNEADRLVTPPVISQREMEDDHEGFRCVGPHNCSSYPDMICMTGC
ncbi:hypothetical protein [Dyella silvatica]|uniref:hypothetical protein n=1 Tax=Dyella silvatica TaxID=2992128 RepID=UPI002256584E|nr:hypothetical protein [Dyella silvatica]